MLEHIDTKRNYRIEHRANGTFIVCDRGAVASMEAGFQETRNQDAKLIIEALNLYLSQKEGHRRGY